MSVPPYVYDNNSCMTNDINLKQGDILQIEGELRNLFSKFYPDFNHSEKTSDKYVMILNQSCDLFREGQKRKPKIDYIAVCLVRSFVGYLKIYIKNSLKPFNFNENQILDKESYNRLEDKIRKLINNSEGKMIFYLPKHPPFEKDMIAILTLSYPFRTEHYDIFIQHRVLRLKTPFPEKIGDMLANFYGRVGTPEAPMRDEMLKEHIDSLMKNLKIKQVPDKRYIQHIKTSSQKAKIEHTDIEELITEQQILIRQNDFKPERNLLMKKIREKLFDLLSDEKISREFIYTANKDILRKRISLLLKEL